MRPVNLLPEKHRPRRATGAKAGSAYVVLGVLGALLMAVLLFVLTANQISSREEQAAQVQREAQEAEARVAKLGPFANFAQIKQTRVQSVAGLAHGRFDWERFVRELSRVLPAGSWLTELDASTAPASGTGGDAAAITGPSAKLNGCARRQPDVAKLMVRLRQLHRVQDVTLDESVQEAQDTGASGTQAGPLPAGGAVATSGCPGSYKFALVVAFDSAPQPEPEAKRVPASLGGGA